MQKFGHGPKKQEGEEDTRASAEETAGRAQLVKSHKMVRFDLRPHQSNSSCEQDDESESGGGEQSSTSSTSSSASTPTAGSSGSDDHSGAFSFFTDLATDLTTAEQGALRYSKQARHCVQVEETSEIESLTRDTREGDDWLFMDL